MRNGILLSALIAVSGGMAARADEPWITHVYGTHTQVGVLETAHLNESSGVVVSRSSPDVFWSHNDSGDRARVYAFRINANDRAARTAILLGHVDLRGITNIDWEDIARGPDGTLCIFDGGDNNAIRNNKRVIRFQEPDIDPDRVGWSIALPCEVARFEYPDADDPALPASTNGDRYDAECLFVHPAAGDLYVVTKRDRNGAPAARVYRLRGQRVRWDDTTINVLRFVRDISHSIPSMVTAGDIDAVGRRVVLRTYVYAYEYILPAAAPFETLFDRPPVHIIPLGECQGEAICYSADQASLITTSEAFLQFFCPARMAVSIAPWRLANIRVASVGPDRARIRWTTADALDSRVDYGMTHGYGLHATDAAATTDHEITLTSLDPATTYYYRVQSGPLSHPSLDAAEVFHFKTRPSVQADLDHDGDVDLEDFGCFQHCYSGADVSQNDSACADALLDGDGDVDRDDFRLFEERFNAARAAER